MRSNEMRRNMCAKCGSLAHSNHDSTASSLESGTVLGNSNPLGRMETIALGVGHTRSASYGGVKSRAIEYRQHVVPHTTYIRCSKHGRFAFG